MAILLFGSIAKLSLANVFVLFGDFKPFCRGPGALVLVLALIATAAQRHCIDPGVFHPIHWFSYMMYPRALIHATEGEPKRAGK